MTVLITGSTGKTSKRVAQLLQAANIPILVATRREKSEVAFPSTKLDWLDEATFSNPFNQASDISAVYVVPPATQEPAPHVNAFIDFALGKGVKNFVLCAGTSAQKGGMFVGTVWSHLEDLNKTDGVQFAVIRPTWFDENFSEMQHVTTIKEEGVFYSATEDGKMPFISAEDIAEAAVVFLSGKVPYENKDHIILGPELLTHDQVAEIFTAVLKKPVKHVRKTQEEMVEQYMKIGLNPLYANFMPYLEINAKAGSEEGLWNDNDLERLIGRKGVAFSTWVEEEAKKGYWA